MASSDRSKPPVQSVPVKEQMKFPAKPIAPYIPDSKVRRKLSTIEFYPCSSHILFQISIKFLGIQENEHVAGGIFFSNTYFTP